jgi:hypothetical protein
LLYPFIVCQSNGGQYADVPFSAGAQLGMIDASLRAAAAMGATHAQYTVYTALVEQLALVGMAHGFPVLDAQTVGGTEEYDPMPDWSHVTFRRHRVVWP